MEQPQKMKGFDTEAADLVVLAVRSWVRATLKPKDSAERRWYRMAWDSCFTVIGSEVAGNTLDAFLKHFAGQGTAHFSLGCICCGRVSDDERRLVDIVRYLQEGDLSAAQAELEEWFSETALWEAEALCEAFADQLLVHDFPIQQLGTFVYSRMWADRPGMIKN